MKAKSTPAKSQAIETLGLADTLERIKQEIIESQTQAAHRSDPILFKLDSVSIDIKFTIKETVSLNGGVDVKLISIKRDDKVESEKVHTINIKLAPLEQAAFGLLNQDSRKQR